MSNILVKTLKEKIQANPVGLYVLFYTEMWELFGRFAITALLVLYLTNYFHMPDSQAFAIYSAFIALIFATPILGGFLADRYLGSKHAIILGACVMILGSACLVIPNEVMVFVGLAVTAVGCGFFLPSIPPLVGALYEHDERKRDAGFTLYYIGKNMGALLGPILCGIVGKYFGINYAFILSVIGMSSGVLVFIVCQKHLRQYSKAPRVQPKRSLFSGTSLVYLIAAVMVPLVYWVLVYNIDGYLLAVTGMIVVIILVSIYIKRNATERRHLLAIIITTLLMMVFVAFLGQGGTTLNLFIDREVSRHLFSFSMPTSVYYAIDPIFMLIMGPILAGLWMRRAAKNKEPIVTTKFAIGFVIFALGFLTFMVAAIQARETGHASSWFVVLAYYLFPVAELCIVPISLSFLTKMAPKGLDSLLVGVWMLTNAASSYFTGQISKLGRVTFPLHSVAEHKLAAIIYQHLFLVSAIAVALAGILAFVLGPLVKRLGAAS